MKTATRNRNGPKADRRKSVEAGRNESFGTGTVGSADGTAAAAFADESNTG